MQSSSASAASSSVPASLSRFAAAARRPPGGPFAGLVVCVTGLSKGEPARFSIWTGMVWEVRLLRGSCSSFGDFFSSSAEARGQVKEAAERLGGEYSGSLHPKCTHLVVQISLHAATFSFFKIHPLLCPSLEIQGYTMLASLTQSAQLRRPQVRARAEAWPQERPVRCDAGLVRRLRSEEQ
jgi:hypothetical protein